MADTEGINQLTRTRLLGIRATQALALVAMLGLAGCSLFGGAEQAGEQVEQVQTDSGSEPGVGAAATSLFVSTDGSGQSCTDNNPCSFERALNVVESGNDIQLLGGEYGSLVLQEISNLEQLEESVVVESFDAQNPATFAGIESSVPNLTWRAVVSTDVWMLAAGSDHTTLEDIHITGSGLYVRADGIVVKDSLFEGGSSIDGIQIGRANDVLIENNDIYDYDQNADTYLHADCIQVFDSNDVTIRGNRVRDCYNAGLIMSDGSNWGMRNIVVESNFIQGCVEVTDNCAGGSAADIREETIDGLIVRNNTFANGSLRIQPVRNSTFDRNIVTYMSFCDSPLTNSVIVGWNLRWCADAPVVSSSGNQVEQLEFVDEASGDLRVTDPRLVEITSFGDLDPAETAINGLPFAENIAGAWQPQ